MTAPVILCCDWGTTTFRLCLLATDTQQVIGEVRDPVGVARTFGDWQNAGEPNGLTQEAFFRHRLKGYMDQLEKQVALKLAGVPVILSGMASSSIGMVEVPYTTLPFALDGTQATIRYFDPRPDFPHEVRLISGVRSTRDVMRGEETQLLGVWALLGREELARKSVFIFPGTHAKHLFVENEQLTHFNTYMTGELFALLTQYSILANSVDRSELITLTADDRAAFTKGVRQSLSAPVLASLFTVRTNALFQTLTKRQNAFYLSGLLIGSELAYLSARPDWPIVLCSGPNLSAVYSLAIHEFGLQARTTILPPDRVDRAASVGQLYLYQHERERQPIG